MTIGEKIRFARKEKGLTQKDLARLSGVAEISIRNYENGKRQPRAEQLAMVAAALQINFMNFLQSDAGSPFLAASDWLESLGYRVRMHEEEGLSALSLEPEHAIEENRQITMQEYHALVENIAAYTKFQVNALLKR